MINICMPKALGIVIFSVVFIACSNDKGYYDYLCKSQARPDMIDTEVFYGEAMDFWMDRVDTLEELSYRQNDTLRLFLDVQEAIRKDKEHDYLRFANEIKRFVDYDAENTKLENPVLFIGSSTVNLWKRLTVFPGTKGDKQGLWWGQLKRYTVLL